MTRGSSPTLIGRDGELERLRAAISVARDSDRVVILVSGEAGIGKSRLIAELVASVSADPPDGVPVRVVQGACLEVGGTLPYLPILDWLGDLASEEGARGPEARELLDLFGGAPAARAGNRGVPGRAHQFRRLGDLLAGLAKTGAVLAILDDIHWADRSTLDVVTYLARRLARSGATVVLAFRSDELHRRHPLTPVLAGLEHQAVMDHVRLEPLEARAVAEQVAAIGGPDVDPARTAHVVELADGNPFYVEELLALDGTRPMPSSFKAAPGFCRHGLVPGRHAVGARPQPTHAGGAGRPGRSVAPRAVAQP